MSEVLDLAVELINTPSPSRSEAAACDLIEQRLSGAGHLELHRIGDNLIATTRTADLDQAVTFTSMAARVSGATLSFVNSGSTNTATNGFVLTGVTANTFIDKGIFYGTTSANTNYAWYDSGGFVRAIIYGTDGGGNSSTSGTTGTLASKTACLKKTVGENRFG